MFLIDELEEVLQYPQFKQDVSWVHELLASSRLGQKIISFEDTQERLSYFVESVLASAPEWDGKESAHISSLAAEISELLSLVGSSENEKRQMRLKASLLYELADMPSLAGASIRRDDLSNPLSNFISRRDMYGTLKENSEIERPNLDSVNFLERAILNDVMNLVEYEQGKKDFSQSMVLEKLTDLASLLNLEFSATEMNALCKIISKRKSNATRTNIDAELFNEAKKIQFPTELWTSQVDALREGLLDSSFDSWGFAAPTGTGKTFLTRLLILNQILKNSSSKILYIVPSRALVHEVTTRLKEAFKSHSIAITAMSAQLIDLDSVEKKKVEDASVVILTPEKADLLLRLSHDFMSQVSLVIVDEAHHIEAGTRGILLEMYLWRLRRILKSKRIIFLSAVAPNIRELAEWMGNNPGGVTVNTRSTRMKAGVYRIKKVGGSPKGWIDYSDGTSICVVESDVQSQIKKGIVQLAHKLVHAGPVLVVAKGKKECENLADEMSEWLKKYPLPPNTKKESQTLERLDSRLEREMYASVEMRNLIPFRIVYHHAGLPPRVRVAVEEAIRQNLVDYVFATTTLAEGVNFPFSSVIVESLAIKEAPEKGRPSKYNPVTPRSFWNIAGRAGRPGFDKEGQAILFEPSLGLDKVNLVLSDYLNPSMSSIKPVKSALSAGINELAQGIKNGEFDALSVSQNVLPKTLSKKAHGTINLIRTGLVHARASNFIKSPEDILEGSFAARFIDPSLKGIVDDFLIAQDKVVQDFIKSENAPPLALIAELGLSIETLTLLKNYVVALDDWQLKNMSLTMLGGKLNARPTTFIIGPIAKNMSELEGSNLGGFLADIIMQWLSGVPLHTVVSSPTSKYKRLEDLIAIIYSKIQYLLPWGLYAVDRIVEEECRKKKFVYHNELKHLAYLSDAGVPSFDALKLVHLDFERVDATRLAQLYQRSGGLDLGVDIVGWLANTGKDVLVRCIKGIDNRRIDYDFFGLLENLRSSG